MNGRGMDEPERDEKRVAFKLSTSGPSAFGIIPCLILVCFYKGLQDKNTRTKLLSQFCPRILSRE